MPNYWLLHNVNGKTRRCKPPAWIWRIFLKYRETKQRPFKGKLLLLAGDVVFGFMSHIPVCCMFRFLIAEWKQIEDIAIHFGVYHTPCEFVPCEIHKRRYECQNPTRPKMLQSV